MDGSRILIFMDTKKGCDQITRQLRTDGWPALSIHGDKSQAERDWVLSEFKSGKSPIMTATDVAARGLGMLSFLSFDIVSVLREPSNYGNALIELKPLVCSSRRIKLCLVIVYTSWKMFG